MFKILFPLIAVAVVAIFVLFNSLFLNPKPKTSTQTAPKSSASVQEGPLTSTPSAQTQVLSSASPSPSFPSSNQTSINDSRIRTIETAIIDLRAQVAALKASPSPTSSSTTTSTTTTSSSTASQAPVYIPVGAGESSMQGASWTTIPGYEVTINSSDYSGYKTMQLEASIRLNQTGGSIQARLLNASDGTNVSSSELSVTDTTFTVGTSGTFTLPSGAKTYKLQLNPTNGTTSFVQSARIKVNY